MARDFDGTDDIATISSAPVAAAPLTLACWARSSSLTATQIIMGIHSSADDDNYFEIQFAGTVAGDPVRVATADAGGAVTADTSSGYSADTWHHVCGMFVSSTDRAILVDGGSKGTNATSRTPSGLNKYTLGARNGTFAFLFLSGRIAHPAIWNVALTDAEVLELARGASPLQVRPQSLVGYWPLVGNESPEPDIVGGLNLTVNGATKADDPAKVFGPVGFQNRRFSVPAAHTGTGAVTTPIATVSGAGTIGHGGTGAASIPLVTVAGAGALGHTGSGAATAPVPTVAGVGVVGHVGTGAILLPVPVVGGVGEKADPTGTGAVSTPVPTVTGAGALGRVGSGAISTPVPTVTGAGALGRVGSGAISTPAPTASGAGNVAHYGTGAIQTPMPTVSGVGVVGHVGTGAILLPIPAAAGSGKIGHVGIGALALPIPIVSGAGSIRRGGGGDNLEPPRRRRRDDPALFEAHLLEAAYR